MPPLKSMAGRALAVPPLSRECCLHSAECSMSTGSFSHSFLPPLDLSRQTGWSFAQSVAYRCVRLFTVISEKSTCLGRNEVLTVEEGLKIGPSAPKVRNMVGFQKKYVRTF